MKLNTATAASIRHFHWKKFSISIPIPEVYSRLWQKDSFNSATSSNSAYVTAVMLHIIPEARFLSETWLGCKKSESHAARCIKIVNCGYRENQGPYNFDVMWRERTHTKTAVVIKQQKNIISDWNANKDKSNSELFRTACKIARS
jgi:hypothetical protein